MLKHRSTKLMCLLIAFVWMTVIIGSSYAYFIDSVTVTGNVIAAGNLKAGLEYLDKSDSEWKDASNATIFSYQRWEPGYTDVQYIRMSNKGDLALQYELNLVPDVQTALMDVIDVYFGEVETGNSIQDRATFWQQVEADNLKHTGTMRDLLNNTTNPHGLNGADTGVLLKGESKTACIVLHMQEEAGNEYQNLSVGEGFKLQMYATQYMHEEDSFGKDYDKDAVSELPELNIPTSMTIQVQPVNGRVPSAVIFKDPVTGVSATVPAGAKMADGANALSLIVSPMTNSQADIDLDKNEVRTSYNVKIDGLAADNTVPAIINMGEVLPVGLNMGNYDLYHVENGNTVKMNYVDTPAAHNDFAYNPATGEVTVAMATFSEVALVADTVNAWEGKFDYTWYDASKTELTIANADQLAAFGAIVGGMNGQTQDSFKDKNVKLIADVNLGVTEDEAENKIIFYPIGYYNTDGTYEKTQKAITSGFKTFEGTFDGNGHTVGNFYQNTWEMKGDNNYYDASLQNYRDGMGLFGKVYGGTVKNLTVDHFSSDGEYTTTGVIAAYADGATFENIAITNCNPRVYNIGNGGIVGCIGWYAKEANLKTTFKNITVDNSNKISALWGSWDVACGGLVGQYYPTSGQTSAGTPANGGVHFENCHVSAQIDVYNDVCANYQYYAYRYAGMIIGSIRENETIDGHVYPKMAGITAKDCTVHFGTWNDYYYCELVDNTTASYTHDYQMSRLVEIKAINGTTIKYLNDTTGTVPASGRANYVIVDYTKGHGTENATCYHFKDGAVWTHDMGGVQTGIDENGDGQDDLKEDKQHIYLEFNNLFTGYGWGVTSKGLTDFKGIETDIKITEGDYEKSVEKFEGKVSELANNKTYKLGDIFSFVDNGVKLVPGALTVAVTNKAENNPVSATIVYDYDKENWENGTITLTGTGEITITIQDYYFCTPTTITVNVTDRQPAEKFDIVMNNGDFLHRVGNIGTVALNKLFKEKDGVTVGTVSVTVDAVSGTGASGTYSNNAIQFSGTGVVKVTIKDDDIYCIPTVLYLEVVEAKNVTSATSATANNVVLLNNVDFGTIDVKNGYTLYGNGFTMTNKNDVLYHSSTVGFVTLENGTLDNVKIVVPNFSHAVLYNNNMAESSNYYDSNSQKYGNVRSAVISSGNSKILNSYVSGGRAAVYVTGGNAEIDNSTIVGGAAANIHVTASTIGLMLRDVTLIQVPTQATVHNTSKTLMGLSVLMMCDDDKYGANLTLEGYLNQYAWAHEGYKTYVPSQGQSFVTTVLKETNYIHEIEYTDGPHDSLNLGFAFLPTGSTAPENPTSKIDDNRTDGKVYGTVSINGSAYVYSYKNSNGTATDVKTKPAYASSEQAPILPAVTFTDANENRIFETKYDTTKGWMSTLTVDVDAGNYAFSFDKLLVQKYGQNLKYSVKKSDGTVVDKTTVVTLNDSSTTEFMLTITDDLIYDVNGKLTDSSEQHTYIFKLLSTKTSIAAPTWNSTTLKGTALRVGATDWNVALPVLEGLSVHYYSKAQGKEVDLALADIPLGGTGKKSTSNTWELVVENEYTISVTTSGFHSKDNGVATCAKDPKEQKDTLYFTISSSDGYVTTNTTERTVQISYSFTDANNSTTLTHNYSWNVKYSDISSATKYDLNELLNGTLKEANSSCVTSDTLFMMADGTQKRADELAVGDMVKIFNHITGQCEAAPIIFNTHADDNVEKEYDVLHLQFANGKEVKVVASHGFYDMTRMKYVYITYDNYRDYVGHEFYSLNSDGTAGERVKLEKAFIETEMTRIFCPVSYFHMNSFANGFLNTPNIPGDITGLVNYFEYDDDLKYNEETMQRDIEKYGVYTYDEFKDYISEAAFHSSPSVHLKVAVGKGMITFEQILDVIEYLLSGSLID